MSALVMGAAAVTASGSSGYWNGLAQILASGVIAIVGVAVALFVVVFVSVGIAKLLGLDRGAWDEVLRVIGMGKQKRRRRRRRRQARQRARQQRRESRNR